MSVARDSAAPGGARLAVLSEDVLPSDAVPVTAALSTDEVRVIFLGIMLAMFLAALNQTIVATALPTIGRDFADFESLSWVVTAYLLTSTAVAPLYGKLSDIHGRRAMMLAGIGIFLAGSVVCAVAHDMTVLIAGRALQGLGGGGILPIAQAIISDAIAPAERGRYQAFMGTVWVSAGIGGPVLGGFLAEHLHWSMVFWLNVPLSLAAAAMIHRSLKLLPRHDRPHKLDLVGAGLMMASAVPLLLALTWGGTRFAWTSPAIVGLVALSLVLSLLFCWWLTRAPEPFLPIPVLANPVMRMGTAATSCAMATSIGLTIFVPLYFEIAHGLSASDSGLALVPLAALTTPGSIASGQVMLRYRRYKWLPASALAIALAALTVLIWHPMLPLAAAIGVLGIVSVAVGTVYPVATVSIQNAVAHHQVGVAMGAMNFFRALASAFLVAIMGAIVLAGFGFAPERGVPSESVATNVDALASPAAGVFSGVFAAAAVCMLLALLAILALEERPLRGSKSATAPEMLNGGEVGLAE